MFTWLYVCANLISKLDHQGSRSHAFLHMNGGGGVGGGCWDTQSASVSHWGIAIKTIVCHYTSFLMATTHNTNDIGHGQRCRAIWETFFTDNGNTKYGKQLGNLLQSKPS